jgi:hypothetical protein
MAAYDGLDNACIYDFETLSQDQVNGVVLSMAMLNFSEMRFNGDNPHTYEELLEKTHIIKFDVEEQVKKYGRKINKETLKWWGEQSGEAQKSLKPSAKDKSISELYQFFVVNKCTNLNKVYTRGNTFDPIFLEHIMKQCGDPMPYNWWEIRDTRSLIEGLTWGSDLKNSFIPEGLEEKFIAHDPRHDIVMDVMRIQTVVRYINESL